VITIGGVGVGLVREIESKGFVALV
jgi:hypothetical protein